MDENLSLLIRNCVADYNNKKAIYQKMQDYYTGTTDVKLNYDALSDKNTRKIDCNFIKKFIKEECAYVLGNAPTLATRSGDTKLTDRIDRNQYAWSEKHEKELLTEALKFGESYELYYIDPNETELTLKAKICTPLDSYVYEDDYGVVKLFIRFYTKKFDLTQYFDVYTENTVYTFKYVVSNEPLSETPNTIGRIPVSVCRIAKIEEKDTLYYDLKTLQDAFETNLSDSSNEISDFRNAYLMFLGAKVTEEFVEDMKTSGVISNENPEAKVQWLIKNINDTFVKNTMNKTEDLIYQIANHINNNEELVSNTSSLALRTRMISLEFKCKYLMDSMKDCMKKRYKLLCELLNKANNNFDYKDLIITFTPAIPNDDLLMANIVSQLGDKLCPETALSLFSFINNPDQETQWAEEAYEKKLQLKQKYDVTERKEPEEE
jgi:SPP1 family phage portal protein